MECKRGTTKTETNTTEETHVTETEERVDEREGERPISGE